MGSLTFRPTSTASDSHQRLAKAVRKQKGTLVKETELREDPDLEKERMEREEKKRGQKRMREMKKRLKGKEDEDDDAFWDAATRGARRAGARSMVGTSGDGAVGVVNGLEDEIVDAVEDDGFVVDDENDEDVDGDGSQEEDMEVDEEPDEMELMEARMVSVGGKDEGAQVRSTNTRTYSFSLGKAGGPPKGGQDWSGRSRRGRGHDAKE